MTDDGRNHILRFGDPALYVTHGITALIAGFVLLQTQNRELGYACGLIIVLSLHNIALTKSLSILKKQLAAARRD